MNREVSDFIRKVFISLLCTVIVQGVLSTLNYIHGNDVLSTIIFCIYIISVLYLLYLIITYHRYIFTLDSLKIHDVIIITTIHYLLKTKNLPHKENELNPFEIERVYLKHELDNPHPCRGIDDEFNRGKQYDEVLTWAFSGKSISVNPVSTIKMRVIAPFCTGLKNVNLHYTFQMGNSTSIIEPQVDSPPIYGLLQAPVEKPITQNEKLSYAISRLEVTNRNDMFNFLYVLDSLNYSKSVDMIEVSISGFSDIYDGANVEVYRFNRKYLTHERIDNYKMHLDTIRCNENVIKHFVANFSIKPENKFVYGYMIREKNDS